MNVTEQNESENDANEKGMSTAGKFRILGVGLFVVVVVLIVITSATGGVLPDVPHVW